MEVEMEVGSFLSFFYFLSFVFFLGTCVMGTVNLAHALLVIEQFFF